MYSFLEEYGAVIIEFVFMHTVVSILYKVLMIVWELHI